MESYTTRPEEHLFDEIHYQLVQAGGGKRFLNYLVDKVVFFIFMYCLTYTLIALQMRLTIDFNGNVAFFRLFSVVFNLLCYALFMAFTEFILKGKTVGKYLTGTRVVKQDGSPIGFRDAVLRGICRIIPFNVFSALGTVCYPWHDRLSKTYVINEKESTQHIR